MLTSHYNNSSESVDLNAQFLIGNIVIPPIAMFNEILTLLYPRKLKVLETESWSNAEIVITVSSYLKQRKDAISFIKVMSLGNIDHASDLLTSTFNQLSNSSSLLKEEDKLNTMITDNVKLFITYNLNKNY